MKTKLDSMFLRTGYFGRPPEYKKQSQRTTKVHVFNETKNRCLCGYRPHHTMKFQWCSNGVSPTYVECPKCLEVIEEVRKKLEAKKTPLLRTTSIKFPSQKITEILRKMIAASKYRYTETDTYLEQIKELIINSNGGK